MDNTNIGEINFDRLLRRKLGSLTPKSGSKGDAIRKIKRAMSLLEISSVIVNDIFYAHASKELTVILEGIDEIHYRLEVMEREIRNRGN